MEKGERLRLQEYGVGMKVIIGIVIYIAISVLNYGVLMGDSNYDHICDSGAVSMNLAYATFAFPCWPTAWFIAASHEINDGYVPFAMKCED